MFKRFYDQADYQIAYVWTFPFTKDSKIFRILKLKTSKILEKPKYAIYVGLFGREYRLR